MDATDNPFRPEGDLNHQVDPIVEQFKTRPFGGGTASNPGTPEKTVVMQNQPQLQQSPLQQTSNNSSPTKKSGKNGRKGSKEAGGAAVRPSQVELQVTVNDNANGTYTQVIDPKRTTLASPKAGKVELVHLEEKKKKCGCCSIQ